MENTSFRTDVKKFRNPKFSAAYVAKIAILTAISFILYAFCKFNLPFMFPSFLEMQISELPAMLAGFSMGPVSGCIVIVLKCLLKFPLTTTEFVGEATDIILGIAYVLPASLIYKHAKSRKSALIGLAVGSACITIMAIVVNRYISIPFYTTLYFNGNFNVLVGILKPLYKDITIDSFYLYYLSLGVLPFNLLRCIIVSLITALAYKKLSRILHWEGHSLKALPADAATASAAQTIEDGAQSADGYAMTDNTPTDNDSGVAAETADGDYVLKGVHRTDSVEETYALAAQIAKTLSGGEKILLTGELGAGKTTFTKGLAEALGVTEEVTSPTFTILNVYESGRLKLNHLDMYRLESEDDLVEVGVEDAIADGGVTVIEWNKLTELDGRIIRISVTADGENGRIFDIEE